MSRFISGKTDKLGDESIIRIARAFEVSTDFLLGEVDEPDRKNYDISELGLSVEVARNLYTQKVNPKIVRYLLENPQFADTTYQIARYLDNELTAGFAAQNQFYSMASSMLGAAPQAADAVRSLRTPIDQVDLSPIQNSFMKAVRTVKKKAEVEMLPTRQLTAQVMKSIYAELTKGGQNLNREITKEQVADALVASVLHLPGDERLLRIEAITDPYALSPEQAYIKVETLWELYAALDKLEPREQTYLLYRLGFTDDIKHTLISAAIQFHLSENQTKLLEDRSLDTLRREML